MLNVKTTLFALDGLTNTVHPKWWQFRKTNDDSIAPFSFYITKHVDTVHYNVSETGISSRVAVDVLWAVCFGQWHYTPPARAGQPTAMSSLLPLTASEGCICLCDRRAVQNSDFKGSSHILLARVVDLNSYIYKIFYYLVKKNSETALWDLNFALQSIVYFFNCHCCNWQWAHEQDRVTVLDISDSRLHHLCVNRCVFSFSSAQML